MPWAGAGDDAFVRRAGVEPPPRERVLEPAPGPPARRAGGRGAGPRRRDRHRLTVTARSGKGPASRRPRLLRRRRAPADPPTPGTAGRRVGALRKVRAAGGAAGRTTDPTSGPRASTRTIPSWPGERLAPVAPGRPISAEQPSIDRPPLGRRPSPLRPLRPTQPLAPAAAMGAGSPVAPVQPGPIAPSPLTHPGPLAHPSPVAHPGPAHASPVATPRPDRAARLDRAGRRDRPRPAAPTLPPVGGPRVRQPGARPVAAASAGPAALGRARTRRCRTRRCPYSAVPYSAVPALGHPELGDPALADGLVPRRPGGGEAGLQPIADVSPLRRHRRRTRFGTRGDSVAAAGVGRCIRTTPHPSARFRVRR